MSGSQRATVWVLLAAAWVLWAAPAEARFGKRSKSSSDDDETSASSSKKKSTTTSSDSAPSPSTHEATAVGAAPSYGTGYASAAPADPYRPYRYWGWGFAYQPVYYVPMHSEVARSQPAVDRGAPVTASVSGGVLVFGAAAGGGGAGLDLGMMFEGERLGFAGTFSALGITADDGSGEVDSIRLLNAFLTYSLISRPEGRLRVEGGAMTAFAPELIVMGPAMGVSGAVGLLGPLGADASVRTTVFPYRQLDAQAGLTIGVGSLGLRGGMRAIYLDDAGLLDGVVHTDTFVGPYAGLELVF